METNNETLRRELMGRCRQMVVKAGTRLLTDPARIGELVDGIAAIRKKGSETHPDGGIIIIIKSI